MLALAKRPSLALDVNIVQDNLPIEIAPNLYIGSIHAAFNQDALISHKITHVSDSNCFGWNEHIVLLNLPTLDKSDVFAIL